MKYTNGLRPNRVAAAVGYHKAMRKHYRFSVHRLSLGSRGINDNSLVINGFPLTLRGHGFETMEWGLEKNLKKSRIKRGLAFCKEHPEEFKLTESCTRVHTIWDKIVLQRQQR